MKPFTIEWTKYWVGILIRYIIIISMLIIPIIVIIYSSIHNWVDLPKDITVMISVLSSWWLFFFFLLLKNFLIKWFSISKAASSENTLINKRYQLLQKGKDDEFEKEIYELSELFKIYIDYSEELNDHFLQIKINKGKMYLQNTTISKAYAFMNLFLFSFFNKYDGFNDQDMTYWNNKINKKRVKLLNKIVWYLQNNISKVSNRMNYIIDLTNLYLNDENISSYSGEDIDKILREKKLKGFKTKTKKKYDEDFQLIKKSNNYNFKSIESKTSEIEKKYKKDNTELYFYDYDFMDDNNFLNYSFTVTFKNKITNIIIVFFDYSQFNEFSLKLHQDWIQFFDLKKLESVNINQKNFDSVKFKLNKDY